VKFTDATLLRLATPLARDALFDAAALQQIVRAAYDTEALALDGPFNATFDELQLAVAVPGNAIFEGAWTPIGTASRVDARFQIAGLSSGDGPLQRVDALWRGSIVARASSPAGRIVEVVVTVANIGTIDAQIIDEEGGLPATAEALEIARRTRLLDRLRLGADQPDAVTDNAVAAFLTEAGVATVGQLLTRQASAPRPIAVRLRYEPLGGGVPSAIPLPIAAAVLIRDAASFSLGTLLTESAVLRERVAQLGIDAMPRRDVPAGQQVRARRSIIVVWLLEEAIFDDDDWPGGSPNDPAVEKRAARRRNAGEWLAREGIGLAVPPA
jgi:hypothetical protein